MSENDTNLKLFQRRPKADITDKAVALINDDSFDINSLSSKEVHDISELLKKLFTINHE